MGERVYRTEEDFGYSRRPHEYHRRRLRLIDVLASHKLWMSISIHMADLCRDVLGGAQIVKNEFGET